MGDYKLSALLEEHEDDVRGVTFPDPKTIYTASRDATVRRWQLLSDNPPKYDCSIVSHGSTFINAITYLPPSKQLPEGLIISGGKETIIEARQPGKPPEENAEALMLGHAHNVCALDVSPKGNFVVSGSWDNTARIWNVGKWECSAILEGHGGSVWTVLAYDSDMVITGCADKIIRLYAPSGKLLKTFKDSSDVVRALCRVPHGHSSNAEFASAGNDGIIRLFRFDKGQVGELHGHESFIYSLVSSPSGELISSGEDRTVRIWKDDSCIQTITHPAISVWGVAVCSANGDIVTGASDRKARVFSRDAGRQAAPEAIQAFEDSVKSSSIPQQQVSNGDINKEKLPGPEFLEQKSGTKEGQVVMIQEPNGAVTAHQWSMSAGRWMNVGTVVDAAGSSGKKTHHQGKDYDYVFDVDIEDGKPPLKLPYNLSQNPYEAATKFIQDNELPITYLDQVANFITTNTQGATLGQQAPPEPVGADPWGSGRYVPGQAASSQAPTPTPSARPKVLPQTTYLSIKTANLRTIFKKIAELNEQLRADEGASTTLSSTEVSTLGESQATLESALSSGPQANPALNSAVPLVLTVVASWPPSHVLPALDLLRLFAAATPATASYRSPNNESIVDILSTAGVFSDADRPNNIMLATRAFSNLFETEAGRTLADTSYSQIHTLIKGAAASANLSNRTLAIAAATLYVNYTVLLTDEKHKDSQAATDRGLELVDDLSTLIKGTKDSEAVYRALVAFGTVLGVGEEVRMAAVEIYDAEGALKTAEGAVKEPRIKGVVEEIRGLLKG